MEVVRRASVVACWDDLRGRDVQERCEADVCEGGALADPARLFNSSLEGNVLRAIDRQAGEKINEKALKAQVRAAVALNMAAVAHRTCKKGAAG